MAVIKGILKNPCGNGNIQNLDWANVTILVLKLCSSFQDVIIEGKWVRGKDLSVLSPMSTCELFHGKNLQF